MSPTPQQRLLVDLARVAVQAAAPDELALYDQTSKAYLRRPRDPERVAHGNGFDDPLSFGLDLSLPVPSVAALGVAQAVVVYLAAKVGAALQEESASIAQAWVRRASRRLRPREDGAAADGAVVERVAGHLTPELLAKVREIAHDQAIMLDMPQNKAALMADAIVGRLSLPDRTG